VALGERRERFRATFGRGENVDVFACERVNGAFPGGRLLAGRLIDLSLQGLRMALEEVAALDGPPTSPQRGETFAAVCIQGLPYTPTIQCGGLVAHVLPTPETAAAGFLLTGLKAGDQDNIERILARRFPTTFGQSFPRKNRKTDLADQPGPPLPTLEAVKAPEVVSPVLPPAPAKDRPARPEVTPVIRIRKAVRKILVISAGTDPGARSLAQDLRDDDFRQVYEARSYLEAQQAARASRFDIVLLDVRVGGHYGQMILEALRSHDLLVEPPVILVADKRDASIDAVAEAIGAVCVHEKRAPYEEILPVLYRLMA
jgi:CheY-like chemotaxis protein